MNEEGSHNPFKQQKARVYQQWFFRNVFNISEDHETNLAM